MLKRRRCEEVVGGNGKQYRFAATFGNIEAASFLAGDPGDLFGRLCDDELPPGDIRNVIMCCVIEVDGEPVADVNRDAIATEFVEDFGLTDCSLLCRHLLSHVIIGTVKKKQIDRGEKTKSLVKKLNLLTLIPLERRGWSWVMLLLTSTALACMIIKYA